MVASVLAETLAALHAVDPLTAGLGDFGRIGGYCQRQLATWAPRATATPDQTPHAGYAAGPGRGGPGQRR
ncbi:MAG TPA: phosphotransferase [Trebonia sp.]